MPNVGKLMGTAELAELFCVSRQRVWQITSREDFPAPFDDLRMGKVWLTEDVKRWAKENGRDVNQ